jgi:hypothetical protein
MKVSELTRLQELLNGNSVVAQIARLEHERSSWMNSLSTTRSLAEQYAKLVDHDSTAVRIAKQVQDAQKVHDQSIRKMLDPLAGIRADFLADDSFAFLRSFQMKKMAAVEHAQKLMADASVSTGLQQMMKSFDEVNKHWAVPNALMEAMRPLNALQDQLGRLNLPIIDLASAATLAKVLGQEGIESQLAALGINPDGSHSFDFEDKDAGIGLSRKTMELLALISFILAVLVPIYQEYSSAQWQAETTKSLKLNSGELENQRKMIESLTKLVEKALIQETKTQEERFVVRDRVAVVRANPEHGATVVGKLLPQEVVRPISEDGKWIEFEYYHWLHQEYRTGWALKKYFQRVARPADAS